MPFQAFLIHTSNMLIYVVCYVCLVGGLSCAEKPVTLNITCKLFNKICSYLPYFLAPLTSTISPLSVIFLTFTGGHRSWSVQSKTPWLDFLAHFSTHQDEIWYGVEAIEVEHPDDTLSRFIETREITAVLLTTSKSFSVGMNADIYKPIWCDDRYCWTLHFGTCISDFDLHSSSQGCEKVKTSLPVISQSS